MGVMALRLETSVYTRQTASACTFSVMVTERVPINNTDIRRGRVTGREPRRVTERHWLVRGSLRLLRERERREREGGREGEQKESMSMTGGLGRGPVTDVAQRLIAHLCEPDCI